LGIIEEEGEVEEEEMEMGLPIELARGTGSGYSTLMIPSQVRYCRELLRGWTIEKGIDYEFCEIG
jgi:hypothetical protein